MMAVAVPKKLHSLAVRRSWSATAPVRSRNVPAAQLATDPGVVAGCQPYFEKVWAEAEDPHRFHRPAFTAIQGVKTRRMDARGDPGDSAGFPMSYGQVLASALKFGESLKAMLAVEPPRKPTRLERRFQGTSGDALVILLPGGPEFLASFYGAAYAGVATAAVSPNYSPKQIGKVLVSTNANAVVTNKDLLPKLCNGIIAAGVKRYLDDYFMEEHVGVEISPEGIVTEIEPDVHGRMNRKVFRAHPSLLNLVHNPIWKAGMRPDDFEFWCQRIIIVGEEHPDLQQLASFSDLVSGSLPVPAWRRVRKIDGNKVVTRPHPLPLADPDDLLEGSWFNPQPISTSLTHAQLNGCLDYNLSHSPEVQPAIRRTGEDAGDHQDVILSTLAMDDAMTVNTTLGPTFVQGAHLVHLDSSNPLDLIKALGDLRPNRLHVRLPHLVQLLTHPYLTPEALESVQTVLYPKANTTITTTGSTDHDPLKQIIRNLGKGPLRDRLINWNLVPILTHFSLCK